MAIPAGSQRENETLLRAAVLFKFGGTPDADIYLGSPPLAAALHRLLQSVVQAATQAGGTKEAEGWRRTYRLAGHAERWNTVAAYAARHPRWDSLGSQERRDWIDVIASPYWLSEEEYGDLIQAAEESNEK
ncbi:hypothetical protein ABZ554_04805 [Streptomyces sp. NPDC020125]|uniref:hypothetical protein n=1 Tax=Streptomyces sp. NPDC020125 TaxID=3154593 RepID=UPI00340FB148